MRHPSETQLHKQLHAHNKPLEGRGVSCQCMECLYNRWYWKNQYGVSYPDLPEWAKKIGVPIEREA